MLNQKHLAIAEDGHTVTGTIKWLNRYEAMITDAYGRDWSVHPDALRRFTGFMDGTGDPDRDILGEEIYEGNTLLWAEKETNYPNTTGVVKFSEKFGAWVLVDTLGGDENMLWEIHTDATVLDTADIMKRGGYDNSTGEWVHGGTGRAVTDKEVAQHTEMGQTPPPF